ncbi:hypothetical protein EV360DRAFT_74487 [Lentinula raphanica]|nr:hypothetical protein EV360DRAFT_74487 [Lentinula raphanica]
MCFDQIKKVLQCTNCCYKALQRSSKTLKDPQRPSKTLKDPQSTTKQFNDLVLSSSSKHVGPLESLKDTHSCLGLDASASASDAEEGITEELKKTFGFIYKKHGSLKERRELNVKYRHVGCEQCETRKKPCQVQATALHCRNCPPYVKCTRVVILRKLRVLELMDITEQQYDVLLAWYKKSLEDESLRPLREALQMDSENPLVLLANQILPQLHVCFILLRVASKNSIGGDKKKPMSRFRDITIHLRFHGGIRPWLNCLLRVRSLIHTIKILRVIPAQLLAVYQILLLMVILDNLLQRLPGIASGKIFSSLESPEIPPNS